MVYQHPGFHIYAQILWRKEKLLKKMSRELIDVREILQLSRLFLSATIYFLTCRDILLPQLYTFLNKKKNVFFSLNFSWKTKMSELKMWQTHLFCTFDPHFAYILSIFWCSVNKLLDFSLSEFLDESFLLFHQFVTLN